jgi:hypothetical protein
MAVAVALLMGVAFVSTITADKNEQSKLATLEEVPGTDELKAKDGVAEGHKTPLELVKKAIAAAKADELANLKACFNPEIVEYVDNESWDSGDEKLTNLQHIGKLLKGYNAETLMQLEQNTVGNYAVVACKNGEKVNIVKVVRKQPEGADTSGGKKTHNWYLAGYSPYEYRIDYNTSGVKTIRDAIEKGDVAKMKEHLDEWQTETLDLLEGVQEGVDPYGLLMKRMQKIIKNAEEPKILVSRNMNSIAYWFHSDTADTFLVISFNEEYNWEDDTRSTKAKIDLETTARFHRDAGQEFKNFVSDWDWG